MGPHFGDLAQRLTDFADSSVNTLQPDAWRLVSGAATGPETATLDPKALIQLSATLTERESAINALLTEIRDRLQSRKLPAVQREPLQDAEKALQQMLDGVRKLQATLGPRSDPPKKD